MDSALESLDLNRDLDAPVGIAYCLIMLSYIHLALGDYEQAYSLSSESLAICRDLLGDPHGTADSLITLSRAARQMGQFDQAGRWAQEGLEISRETNDRWSEGQTLRQLGWIHFELGEAREAADLLRQSIFQFREVGDRPLVARASIELGVVLRESGSYSESKRVLQEALQLAVETQTLVIAGQALLEIAVSEIKQGENERALERVAFILKSAATNQEVKERAGHLHAELAALLSPEQIEAVQARARKRTLEDLVNEVLPV
jgi:tetratricopeptide (TPR) repeat protein